MFGIMALANLLIFGLQLFSDIGLQQNLIQSKRGNDPVFINTAWTVQIYRGALLWSLGLILALGIYFLNLLKLWPVSTTFAEPILPLIIAVISFNSLITGFNSTKRATSSRSLSLGRITLIDIFVQVIGIVVTVIWAWLDKSVWALVGGALVSSVLGVILSHKMLPGVSNHLHWNKNAFDEIFKFGKWIFVTSILGFLCGSSDRLILGSLVDANTLGLYAIALLMKTAIQDILAKLSSSIGFPAFSEIFRERPHQLKEVYYKLRAKFDIFSLFIAGLLFSSGHLIIALLYDSRYQPAGHMLEILSLGILGYRYVLAEHLYNAIGKPKISVPLLFIRMLAMIILTPIAFHFYQLEGALWAIMFTDLVSIPLAIKLKIQHNIFDLKKELIVLPFLFIGYAVGRLLVWLVTLTGFIH